MMHGPINITFKSVLRATCSYPSLKRGFSKIQAILEEYVFTFFDKMKFVTIRNYSCCNMAGTFVSLGTNFVRGIISR